MGYGTTLFAFSNPKQFITVLEDMLDKQTTDVSIAYLKAMMDGVANKDWIDLFQILQENKTNQLIEKLYVLKEKGHTSGADTLYGMELALMKIDSESEV